MDINTWSERLALLKGGRQTKGVGLQIYKLKITTCLGLNKNKVLFVGDKRCMWGLGDGGC